jgi:hypothetical protein
MKKRLLPGASCAVILWFSNSAQASTSSPAAPPAPTQTKSATMMADQQPADPCENVASARFTQWNQKRFMIRQTETFADGTKKEIEAIFTEDAAYGHEVGKPWMTMNLVRKERAVPPPDVLVKSMGLAECQLTGPAQDTKEPSTLFTYGYLPDSNASHVGGKMWISDSSRLPLRQELAQEEETHHNVRVAIAATYAYGDDLQVPSDAIRSDDLRRWLQQQGFLSATLTVGGRFGSGSHGSGSPSGGHR